MKISYLLFLLSSTDTSPNINSDIDFLHSQMNYSEDTFYRSAKVAQEMDFRIVNIFDD